MLTQVGEGSLRTITDALKWCGGIPICLGEVGDALSTIGEARGTTIYNGKVRPTAEEITSVGTSVCVCVCGGGCPLGRCAPRCEGREVAGDGEVGAVFNVSQASQKNC